MQRTVHTPVPLDGANKLFRKRPRVFIFKTHRKGKLWREKGCAQPRSLFEDKDRSARQENVCCDLHISSVFFASRNRRVQRRACFFFFFSNFGRIKYQKKLRKCSSLRTPFSILKNSKIKCWAFQRKTRTETPRCVVFVRAQKHDLLVRCPRSSLRGGARLRAQVRH